MRSIATITSAADRLEPGVKIPWHRHRDPYIAVVACGRIEEVGEYGRRTLSEGDFVVHEAFEAHADQAGAMGAEIINLPLRSDINLGAGLGVTDIGALLDRIGKDGASAAAKWLLLSAATAKPRNADWPDELASDLAFDCSLSIVQWAELRGLSPETVSRGFRRAFGISPKSFRAIVRARKATAALRATNAPLAQIAQDFGFSDQAHFSRAVTDVTGVPPARWRRSNGYNIA